MARAKSKKNFVEKRSKYLIIAAVALIAVLGVSYAWFTQVLTGNEKATITAGNLTLALENEENAISIEKAVPMSDTQGLETIPYTFTLSNNGDGNIPAKYTIYLDDDAITGTRMADSVIKYDLQISSGGTGSTMAPQFLTAMTNRVIDSGTIEVGASKTYTLRLWIADTATSDIRGQQFAAKIRIDASQTDVDIPNDKELDYESGQAVPKQDQEG